MFKPEKEIRVRVHFFEEILGTSNNNPDIHRDYIASKSENPVKIEEEIKALGVDGVEEKQMTVFPRTEDGKPMFWDYQWRGFFKDTCSALRKVAKSKSSKVTAFKKIIDGNIFIKERKIPIEFNGEMGDCERPLRASTPQGERIALAHSESVPVGATAEFTILLFDDKYEDTVREWLDYGFYRGMGQWRNSGKGRFVWEELDKDGNVIGGNMSELENI